MIRIILGTVWTLFILGVMLCFGKWGYDMAFVDTYLTIPDKDWVHSYYEHMSRINQISMSCIWLGIELGIGLIWWRVMDDDIIIIEIK